MVFDQYDSKMSIKADECQRRDSAIPHNMATYHIHQKSKSSSIQAAPHGANKADLVSFVSDYIIGNAKDRLPNGTSLMMAEGFQDGETVTKVTGTEQEMMDEPFSTQEEADTGMVLHALSLSSQFARTLICSDETDVLVLLLYYTNQGQLSEEVFMHARLFGQFIIRERFIPIREIAAKVGDEICQSILATHALTRCNSTSSLFGIGKK